MSPTYYRIVKVFNDEGDTEFKVVSNAGMEHSGQYQRANEVDMTPLCTWQQCLDYLKAVNNGRGQYEPLSNRLLASQ